MKLAIAYLIAFAIGFLCGRYSIPLPAQISLIGVGLILALTIGYLLGK